MRVSLSWLEDFLSPLPPVDSLAETLTSLGMKVEAIHRPSTEIEKVEVGEVVSIRDHPSADNLILVVVATGDSEREIVCGARNFVVGDKVPIALAGARLPGGLEVGRRTIRGAVSDAMLCSPRELGVGDDHSGILVLSRSAQVGTDVREVLGLDETVLELEITPNRPDAMSLIGIAREAAAALRGEVKLPEVVLKESSTPISSHARVEVEDALGCPRYLARLVLGVSPGPSPGWVQKRLASAGIHPISTIVDATNYALVVVGHPMHAFDLATLHEKRIVVRKARKGERLMTIDEIERDLDSDDLVIADGERAVALAGVMGGLETAISDSTQTVLLESAYFDPRTIYRASKRHGLRTEASARFERGCDPELVPTAADYATSLMLEWAGGELCASSIDIYPNEIKPITVSMRAERANLLLGTDLGIDEMSDALRRLDFEPETSNGTISVVVPTRRPDITLEEDLVEEVGRVYGYENIPVTLPSGRNRSGGLTREQQLVRRVKQVLAGAGITEAQTWSFISPEELERLGYPESHPVRTALRLANPLSQDDSILRPTLLAGLASSLARNVSRRNLTVRLFEIGHCFLPSGDHLPNEPLRLGIAMHGTDPQEWHRGAREIDFFDLKGVLEALSRELLVAVEFEAIQEHPFHPTRAARVIVEGEGCGALGELGREATRRLDVPGRILVCEIDLAPLLRFAQEAVAPAEPPRFPEVLMDLSVSVPEEVPAAEILATAREAGGATLEVARIFDVYRGEQIEAGRKSVALALSFRAPERTLKDSEAREAWEAIAAAIRERHGGRVRS